MLKASRYNFWAKYEGGRNLLYNGLTGALYELDDRECAVAHRVLEGLGTVDGLDDPSLHQSLIQGGFLVPEEIDEAAVLLKRNQFECVHHDILDLVVSPTYECNFRCKYCYIDFRPGRMSRGTEERIVNYVDKTLTRFRQVNVSWFGGEPLLCLNTVVRVSQELTRRAHNHDAKLSIFITTNGFLLSPHAARKLSDAGIQYFHVTVDGTSPYHDQLRVPAGGTFSHALIMANLIALLENIPNAHVTLRMNANEQNIESFCELLNVFPDTFRQRVQVNVTPILIDEEPPPLELYRKINCVTRYALSEGYLYYDTQVPVKRRTFCTADKYNNFHIGPDATIYKCSPSDKPEVKVGFLGEQGTVVLNENYERWHSVPAVNEVCLDCRFLCFCAGGCRLARLRGTPDLNCRDKYEDMENLIIIRYIAACHSAIDVRR